LRNVALNPLNLLNPGGIIGSTLKAEQRQGFIQLTMKPQRRVEDFADNWLKSAFDNEHCTRLKPSQLGVGLLSPRPLTLPMAQESRPLIEGDVRLWRIRGELELLYN